MSSGKGGGAKQDNYYGTLAGAVCIGPVKKLVAIILGGKYWYKPASPLVRGVAAYVDIPDTRGGARNGKLRFYWGTEAQVADPTLVALQGANNVPPYRGVCYFVLTDFLFGTGAGTAPNLEFIVQREPQQDIVTGSPAALDSDSQANPIAAAAEVARAWYGLDMPAADIDAPSFQALADEINGSAERRMLINCSPLWTSAAAARSLLLDLGAPGDLWFRLGSTNLIETGRWTETGPVGAITTLDANAFVGEPEVGAAGVDELTTSVSVDFADRAYAYADSSEKVDELALLRQQGKPTGKKLKRDQVTRREQARAQAAAELRRASRVILRGSRKVRRARAVNPDGSPIRPGDWFMMDMDPEPGGAGVTLLCRCIGRVSGPTGPVTLEWETDPGAVPEAYQPDFDVDEPATDVIAPLDVVRVLSLPNEGNAEAPTISVLAVRGDETWERVEALFSDEAAGDYVSIGYQVGFACPATLVSAIGQDDTTIRIALVTTFAGLNGDVDGTLDADLLREAVGSGTDLAARNDELLLVLVRKDGAGAVEPNGTFDWVEACSVIDVTPVSAGVYDVQVIRGRINTRGLAFDTVDGTIAFPASWDDYEVWCIPRSRLARLSHADFATMLLTGEAGYFRLAAASAVASYDPSDAEAAGLQPDADWRPQRSYAFPAGVQKAPQITITAPLNGAQIPTSGLVAVNISIEDSQADLVEVAVFSEEEDTGGSYTEYVRKLIPASGLFTFATTITVPAVEGNHRLLVQARDLTSRVVQKEVTVFRFTTATPVPPLIGALFPPGPPFYYYLSGFTAPTPNGYVVRYQVEKPAGIDYVAVPHTLQIRSRRSDGTWTSFVTFAPNWFSPGMGWNYVLPKGARRQLRLRRDGDGVVSSLITLTG
jgi:hypothetical protein